MIEKVKSTSEVLIKRRQTGKPFISVKSHVLYAISLAKEYLIPLLPYFQDQMDWKVLLEFLDFKVIKVFQEILEEVEKMENQGLLDKKASKDLREHLEDLVQMDRQAI